jgi:nucleoside-diphosphate-sugar epimerase
MQARRKIAVARKIALAGAPGNFGRHIADVLEAQGHDVVGMSPSLGVDVLSKR